MRSAVMALILALAPGAAAPGAVAPGATADKTVVEGDLGRTLDTYLGRLERLGFSGTVLVAKDGKVVLAKGYGMADREKKIPMTADSVISTGSITKQFTAAAILKLEMQGKLRVEAPISKYLPGVPPDKAAITIHELLTHTAGLDHDYGPGDFEVVGRDAYVKRVLAAPLMARPGQKHSYSNAGYSLLAAIVELVSKQPYERFLRDSLFEPAGMRETGYRIPSWRAGQVAHGYRDGEAWGTILARLEDPSLSYWNLVGNGGIHSTVWDMYRWHEALEGEKVLSKEAKAKYFKPYVEEGPGAGSYYAYGWAVFTTPRNTRLVAHNGGNGIFAADFHRYMDENTFIYAASNADPTAIALTDVLPAVVFGMPYTMPPEVVSLEAAALDRLAGEHDVEGVGRVTVARRGDHLTVEGTGRAALGLLYASVPDDVAARASSRVEAIVASAAKGDFKPLAEAFGGAVPAGEVEARETEMWRSWRERFGAFKDVEVLGTYRLRPAAATIARLDFERGSLFVRYGWEGGQLVGIRVMLQAPAGAFYPTSPTEFTSFDLRDPARTILTFAPDGRIAVRRTS
jgi:CubicO group peptidase (beta-lactamase class C family)